MDVRKRIDAIVRGEQGLYSHWFAHRDGELPEVVHNPFDGIRNDPDGADHFVTRVLLDRAHIGWAAKALLNIDLFPEQVVILQVMFDTPFPLLIASRGFGKTFLLAVYCVLRALLDPGVKIIIVGSGLRQAKFAFGEMQKFWTDSPVLRSLVGTGRLARTGAQDGPRVSTDRCYFNVGMSEILAIPTGDGSKIRGFRANVILADEFDSIDAAVFEIVIRGFASTTKSPVEEARRIAKERQLEKLGLSAREAEAELGIRSMGNQIVLSGTAGFHFRHLFKYYNKFRSIILSRGDKGRLAEVFGEDGVPDDLDWRDYAVVRIPYTQIPPGIHDPKQIAGARAVLPRSIFNMEFGACFQKDSDGYFKMSMLDACTPKPGRPIRTADGDAEFTAQMYGDRGGIYIMGVDPAGEWDNLAVVILQVFPRHFRVVHCWTTNKDDFESRRKAETTAEEDYYTFVCRRIRHYLDVFAPSRIEMDADGGGRQLGELLRNRELLRNDESPIWPVRDTEDKKSWDSEPGSHILKLVNQTNEWNCDSNHALHKSLETKKLLFPAVDQVKLIAAAAVEDTAGIRTDTLDDCVTEIEELKRETANIRREATPGGRERFATPSAITGSLAGSFKKTTRFRKDRYSALLLAHRQAYDSDIRPEPEVDYDDVAGNIQKVKADPSEGMYRGAGVGRCRNADSWAGTGGKGVQGGERI